MKAGESHLGHIPTSVAYTQISSMESIPYLSSIKIDILRQVGKVTVQLRRRTADLGLGIPLKVLHGHIYFTSFRLASVGGFEELIGLQEFDEFD